MLSYFHLVAFPIFPKRKGRRYNVFVLLQVKVQKLKLLVKVKNLNSWESFYQSFILSANS